MVQVEGVCNDASRLNATRIASVWPIPTDQAQAEAQLAQLLQHARSKHLKVSIAGTRHSMGKHTIAENGIVVDMLPFQAMSLNPDQSRLRVQAGARWRQVIRYLNERGLSVEIMQSNDDFSVGGSLSVNCHGWQFGRPPIASSVESLRVMLSDGQIMQCSRNENAELFSLVLGGYGLFGVILEAELRVVPNEVYRMERFKVATKDYVSALNQQVTIKTNVAMVYGRLRVTPESFLQEAVLNVLFRESRGVGVVSEFGPGKFKTSKRAVFRGSADSEYGKQLRWRAETSVEPWLAGEAFERNRLLSDSAEWFANHSTNSTDILVECFVPPGEFEAYLEDLRRIIPKQNVDLLNVTVRHVDVDRDVFLRYADREMIALVMLFQQPMNAAGEERMRKLTQGIIASALRHGGRYYLPYRGHATKEQFYQAYPQAREFFTKKREYDPEEIFENGFYRQYGE